MLTLVFPWREQPYIKFLNINEWGFWPVLCRTLPHPTHPTLLLSYSLPNKLLLPVVLWICLPGSFLGCGTFLPVFRIIFPEIALQSICYPPSGLGTSVFLLDSSDLVSTQHFSYQHLIPMYILSLLINNSLVTAKSLRLESLFCSQLWPNTGQVFNLQWATNKHLENEGRWGREAALTASGLMKETPGLVLGILYMDFLIQSTRLAADFPCP